MNRRLTYISALSLMMLVIGVAACTATAGKTTVQDLSPRQFKSLLDQHRDNPDFVLLDIRTPKEFKDGHIQGALLLDYYSRDFVSRLKTMDKDKNYLIYCRSGNRSGKSMAIFAKLGFGRAYHMDSGLVGWSRAKFPLER